MDDLLLALLWLAAISGGFAVLGLLAEGVEWCAAAFDEWAESISSHYVDEP